MGKYLIIIIAAITLYYGTIVVRTSNTRLEQVEKASRQYEITQARNSATSAMKVAISKLSYDNSWNTGLSNLSLNGAPANVTIEDNSTNSSLSYMERILHSTATFSEVTHNVDAHCGIPPSLANLAAYATGAITNVDVWDEASNSDPTLMIENAPFMIPFDFDALEAIATAQGHVYNSDFIPTNNYPNGDFYYDGVIPNVTKVTGDFTVKGGRDVYGIYIVYGNTEMEGNARLNGVVTLPNPGTVVVNGGGVPIEPEITGGVFINGTVDGTGNHIQIKYDSVFMSEFAKFQLPISLYVISWTESPAV